MKKNSPQILYDYVVHNISEDDTPAYKAYIPSFHAIVYGDNHKELEEGILFAIESAIADLKKAGKSIPPPDREKKFSGKFVLRVPSALHERLAIEAKAIGESLNGFLTKKLMQI